MAATINNTLVKIQTVTVGSGGASSIDFTSIPQTYTDLVIKMSIRETSSGGTDWLWLQFNSDTSTSNYKTITLRGNGSTTGSQSVTSEGKIRVGITDTALETANTFSNCEAYIPNYTSANYKSVSSDLVAENNGTSAWDGLNAGLWSSTSAITNIKIFTSSTIAQYSTATLYGITATPNTTKASGGIIYQDATYMYHVFPYTSTFTPSTSLSADILCIAGGGGGQAGGGGAGGLTYYASQSLSATGYTVTVGAGGANLTQGANSQFGALTASVGGGAGKGWNTTGGNGGSGAGGGSTTGSTVSGGTATSGQGNNGGSGVSNAAGGGGGAGAAGTNVTVSSIGGAGGDGTTSYSSWAIATSTGQIVSGTGYYAGGGGGGDNGGGTARGGYGGGGKGGNASNSAGLANTGGGGGGDYNAAGQTGGSGIVIIRYAK